MEEFNELLLKENFPQWCHRKGGTGFNSDNWNNIITTTAKLAIIAEFIREKFNTVITVERNASGYFYQMRKRDGGTDLGWSDHSGSNMSGCWDEYNEAWKAAIKICLTVPLPMTKKEFSHWGNYVEWVRKEIYLLNNNIVPNNDQ